MDHLTSLNFRRFATILSIALSHGYLYGDDFSEAHTEFKRGNYGVVRSLTTKSIKAQPKEIDPRMLFLYTSTESNPKEIDKILTSVKSPYLYESNLYWKSIKIYLDRLFVLGDNELLIKWGKHLIKDGKGSTYYLDGMLLYAVSLKELQNTREAQQCLSEIEEGNRPDLIEKVQALREKWKKEAQ